MKVNDGFTTEFTEITEILLLMRSVAPTGEQSGARSRKPKA